MKNRLLYLLSIFIIITVLAFYKIYTDDQSNKETKEFTQNAIQASYCIKAESRWASVQHLAEEGCFDNLNFINNL